MEISGRDYQLFCGDCMDVMPTLAAGSVDAIIADPPYFRVLGDDWDNQWPNRVAFLSWSDQWLEQAIRLLKFNGSVFVFAYWHLASHLHIAIEKRLNVLNHIIWRKSNGNAAFRNRKESLRAFIPTTEHIIFAEHYGADNRALGESGYQAECDKLRGFVFEPLRAYLAEEWTRAGLRFSQANDACGTASMAARHFFSQSQWCLPTQVHYEALQRYANRNDCNEYLRRDYEYLRRDYEELRRDYEELRRPFSMTNQEQFSDVWEFMTSCSEGAYHPAQKPLALMAHIINASTRPDATVLDPFAGSGTTGVAALATGRRFIGIDMSARYLDIAHRRIERAAREQAGEFHPIGGGEAVDDLPLFQAQGERQ